MYRIFRKLAVAILASIVVSTGVPSAAQASAPPPDPSGAHIQRDIYLERYADDDAFAWLGARRITLVEGRYRWLNEFYRDDGATFIRERVIDLAAGDYTWNCRVWFDDDTVSTYWSDCYLYRIATGDSAWTEDLRVDARYGSDFTWRSQLIRG
jgi:hypothetical protein